MKKFFIIFVMIAAIGSAYECKAQSKKFLNTYKDILEIQSNTSASNDIELTHLTGEMLQMMVKDDSKATKKLKNRINAIYQIKIADIGRYGSGIYNLLRSVVKEGKYEPCGAFTSNGVKYELYRTDVGDLYEYLIFITSGKKAVVCDLYGAIGYKEVLNMIISPKAPDDELVNIDSLKTN